MKAVFKLEMLKNAQDKGLFFWTFILPIIFTVLFISVLTSTADESLKTEMITSIVPGYTVMFVFFIMISMGASFIDDRDKGMIARLTSTALKPLQYVSGKGFAFMIIVGIQIIVLQIFGKVVYTIPIEQPLFMAVIAAALNFLQQISMFTPQYWAHTGFKDAMMGTTTYSSLLISTLILIGFGCVGLLISIMAYPAFLERAKN